MALAKKIGSSGVADDWDVHGLPPTRVRLLDRKDSARPEWSVECDGGRDGELDGWHEIAVIHRFHSHAGPGVMAKGGYFVGDKEYASLADALASIPEA